MQLDTSNIVHTSTVNPMADGKLSYLQTLITDPKLGVNSSTSTTSTLQLDMADEVIHGQ